MRVVGRKDALAEGSPRSEDQAEWTRLFTGRCRQSWSLTTTMRLPPVGSMGLKHLLPPLMLRGTCMGVISCPRVPFEEHKSVRSRAHSWMITRKLSSDGNLSDSDSDDDVILCEDPEEKGAEDAAEQPLQIPLTPPKAKKPKVEAGDSEAPILIESDSESDDDQPSTSAGKKRKRKAPAPSPETSSDEGPVSPARSEDELEAANALLDLQQSFLAAGEVSPGAEEPPGPSPPSPAPVHPPPTSAGASQMLAPTLLQLLLQPVKDPQPSAPAPVPTDAVTPTPAATVGVEGTGESAASTSPAPSSDGEEPSTSAAAGESAESPGPLVHPYYRIPRVIPVPQRGMHFKVEKATNYGFAYKQYCSQLNKVRFILAKPSLTDVEMNILGQVAAELLSYLYHYEHTATRNLTFSTAARVVGRRVLILDAIVASLHVLGERASGPWWDTIMQVIPDDSLPESEYTPFHSTQAAWFQVNLLKRLHKALRVLKTGHRLSEEETVELKRDLFCSTHSPDNFKQSRWDAWREDDRNHGGAS
ncbi:hypothetical protein Emed_005083 [Eimeria media]